MRLDSALVNESADAERVAQRFYPALRAFSEQLAREDKPGGLFHPSFLLPRLDEGLAELLAPTRIRWLELPARGGAPVAVLDLASDPATRTTKSIASYLMVLRAVAHLRESGERVWLVTPSSANKATALRAAVQRALDLGLATPEQLGIISLVPSASLPKLRGSRLSEEEALASRNPVFLWPGQPAQAVKEVAEAVVRQESQALFERTRIRLWYTLDVRNYRMADLVRALFMAEQGGFASASAVTHVHAVSSGYGLLGYAWGHALLERQGHTLPTPRFFLVQHLATSDLVQYWRTGRFEPLPSSAFVHNEALGEWQQQSIPELPSRCWSLSESLDSTFYTARPATAPELIGHMRQHGGGGIVVSLQECYQRYGAVRAWLSSAELHLPADPRALREHALLMAMTGVLNALERGLLPASQPVLVHNSGSYESRDVRELPARALHVPGRAEPQALADSLVQWVRSLR